MYHEFWTASVVLFALGLVFAIAGVLLRYYGSRNERYGSHAEARVVDIVARPRTGEASLSEFRSCQVAVFEFYASGRPVKVLDSSNTYPCPYRMNQRVQICYDPEDPRKYQILEKNRLKTLGSQCGVLGILCVLTGCGLFLMYAARVTI